MGPVVPILEVLPAAEGVQLVARVQGAPERPMIWRLTVDTRGDGGRSRVAQSGETAGAADRPLATVRVNGPGEAQLDVFDHGRLVASARASFQIP
jgi:hypothetical protein